MAGPPHGLTGTYLGASQYEIGHKGPNRPAVRLYLHPIKAKGESYHAVVLEHVNLLKMAPQYLASQKLPKLNKMIGYLKHIVKRISAYKVTPTGKKGVYKMLPLKVSGNKIEANSKANPSLLTLSKEKNLKNPLEGAHISASKNGEPAPIKFPVTSDKKIKYGMQYTLADFIYTSKKLDSTWRKKYLNGRYLAAYHKKNDVVLILSTDSGKSSADFIINSKQSKGPKRQKDFTNSKSAFIEGTYSISEPQDGMFLFSPNKGKQKDSKHVKGRIGLFIDIFDATKALNQDVVELALIDPKNPEDFLMYYEHPDNGEGKEFIDRKKD
jgi:hypothetical protein